MKHIVRVCVCVCVLARARCGAVAALRCVFEQECLRHEEACGGRRSGASLAGVLPTLYGPSAFQQTGSKCSQWKQHCPQARNHCHLRWFRVCRPDTALLSVFLTPPLPSLPLLASPPLPCLVSGIASRSTMPTIPGMFGSL